MNNVFVILLIFIILLFLAMLFAIWFMKFIIKRAVGDNHSYLQEITHTGKIPEEWSQKYDAKLNRLKSSKEDSEKVARIQQMATKSYLRKLKKLVDYTEKTRLVEDEETRSVILDDLHKLRSKWEAKEIK